MFSIIMPMDTDRLPLFAVTKRLYDAMPEEKEIIIPTRSMNTLVQYLEANALAKDVRLVPYSLEKGFNCARALNKGVAEANSEQIIITSPEVKPPPDLLTKLTELQGQNVVCQVFDEDESHDASFSLVNTAFRNDTPAMYFLAMFNKSDIQKINGWDEAFLDGYAYEDNDFGARWNRAEIPFIIRDDIRGIHQYHPRKETIEQGITINQEQFQANNNLNLIRAERGMSLYESA